MIKKTLLIVFLLFGNMAYAAPLTITWTGTFATGSFDGVDVTGKSYVVRQIGDTTFPDTFPSVGQGGYSGFTTEMDIADIGEFGLVDDNLSGFFAGSGGAVQLTNNTLVSCFLCGNTGGGIGEIDPDALDTFSSLGVSSGAGGFFGFSSASPLHSFNGGRSFAAATNASLLTVSAAVVPEPATILLLGTGLVGLIGYIRAGKK